MLEELTAKLMILNNRGICIPTKTSSCVTKQLDAESYSPAYSVSFCT